MTYIQINEKSSLLAVGCGSGYLCLIDLTSISVVYSDRDFIQSELSFIQFQPAVEAESAKIYTLNMD